MFRLAIVGCAVLLGVCLRALGDEGLLLHYSLDDEAAGVVADASGNDLHGQTGAARVASPSGLALALDGTPATIVRVQIPPQLRFGTSSWSFSAWLNPHQFSIEDVQNQRRVFAFGVYPDAYLVIDLLSTGRPGYYFCYRNQEGTIVSTGGSGAAGLSLHQWAHLALVCDRERAQVTVYVNGYSQGATAIRRDFAGDFSLGGLLTLGSGWHNYWGLLDEVRIYRRALSRQEVKAEFARLQHVFGAVVSPEAMAAEKRELLMERWAQSYDAWAARDFATVRQICAEVRASPDAAPGLRSYAHLRMAQSYVAEGRPDLAREEYVRIAAMEDYECVHRYEAQERVAELEREARGLPARDPAASRTAILAIAQFAAEVFVSPEGNDAGDGTRARPVASLERARDLVRAHRQAGVSGPIAVNLLPGEYVLQDSVRFTAGDSGTPGAPVVYRSIPPGKAVLYGGRRIGGFAPVTDPAVLARLPEEARGHVVQTDLRAQGVEDLGELRVRGFAQPPAPPTLELFVDGKPMTLARWPNEGFVGIARLVEPGSREEKKPSIIEYVDDRHARWTGAEDLWLFGYFRYLWADATIKVSRIDTATRTMVCDEPYFYSRSGMDDRQGIRYYAFNLLEELDRPGEWYLNRKTGVLYLYPPVDLDTATVEVGMLPVPMMTLDGVSDLRFEGLVFDLGRLHGLIVTDCSRCLLLGCTISRLAGNGITIRDGHANGLLGCDLHTIGRRATEIFGGDRATLTPGEHFVENCCLHDFGRIDRTYTPAVHLEGVGNRVAHNLMYNCPSSVMRIEGNDHIIEFNEVHSALLESDDQGVMELYANPTYRGVVFRYNRFTNCCVSGTGAMAHGQAAIRLDDAISGMAIYGNVFIRSANGHFGAIQINSGRDNIIDNNLFVDCARGVSGGWNPGNNVWKWIAEGRSPANFYTTELYLQRYPKIATMMQAPGINHVWRNVFYRCGPIVTGNQAFLDLLDNGIFEETDPGFVDAAAGDFRLRPDAELFNTVGFRPLPLDEIGLYQDRYRASWPVHTTPVQVAEWRQ